MLAQARTLIAPHAHAHGKWMSAGTSAPCLHPNTRRTPRKAQRKLEVRANEGDGQERQQAPPPPPPPPPQQQPINQQWEFEQGMEKFLDQARDSYLPVSFVLGTSTFGLKTSLDNFVFSQDPVGFVGCALMSGFIFSALAWVLFDFLDSPKQS